ncbi:unnamed protein product [Colias eurytheme]|nr:unnamed protein product [Colias eurytheme]
MSNNNIWGCCTPHQKNKDPYIVCVKCEKNYHFACMGLDEASLSPEMRSVWSCPDCVRAIPRASNNDNTPLRNVSTVRGNKRQAVNSPPMVNVSPTITREDIKDVVQEVLKDTLNNLFAKMNDNIVNAINSELKPLKDEITALKNSMMFISDQYEDIKKNHDASQLKISALEKENDGLLHTVSSLEHRCNQIEQQLRQNNIEIQCIPENKNENLLQIIKNLGNVVGCPLEDESIIHYTRISKINKTSPRPRSVIVQLSSTRLRDQFIASVQNYNKKNEKNRINSGLIGVSGNPSPIFVSEHLSPFYKGLHAAARLRAKEKGYNELFDDRYTVYRKDRCDSSFSSKKMEQHNNVLNSTNRILDLVISNNVPLCSVIESVSPLCNLDKYHPPLDIVVTNKIEAKLPYNRFACKFNFFKADYESINNELSTCDWNELFCDLDNVDSMLDILYAKIRNTIHKYVPKIKSKNNKYPPWFNNNLKKMLKEKFKLRQRYRRYNNPRDKIELHIISTRCSKTANICYNLYIRSVEDKIHSNPKYFWSYIKSKRGGNSAYPPSMSLGDEASSDSVRVCELFSKYFGSVYSKRDPDVEEQQPSTIISVNNDLLLTLPRIEYEPLLKKLKAVDVFKGAGPDGIHPKFIVACAENLVQPLLRIFNFSLSYGFFPTNWKVAKVIPIHKSGSKELINNYRPISILSTFAKIFESFICPSLTRHFKQFLSSHQHGFVQHRSTMTNLTDFTETIIDELDSNKQIDTIYADFSKAFDRVPHHILLQKLCRYGLSPLFLKARALDASKPMPIYLAEELPDLPDYSAINRAVPQMPSGMEKEEESVSILRI